MITLVDVGAGSGGYILGWLKRGITKDMVEKQLKTKYPDAELTDVTLCTSC